VITNDASYATKATVSITTASYATTIFDSPPNSAKIIIKHMKLEYA
jgi:hypothetical protein